MIRAAIRTNIVSTTVRAENVPAVAKGRSNESYNHSDRRFSARNVKPKRIGKEFRDKRRKGPTVLLDETAAKEREVVANTAAQQAATAEKKARLDEQRQRELAQWQLSRLYIKDGQGYVDKGDGATAALWYAKALELSIGSDRESQDRKRINAVLRQQTNP
ncbi:hypothetical protein N9242_03145 [Vicingaceae bacterium]|nr:hypothetical protein [Vicingaceae bacterium]